MIATKNSLVRFFLFACIFISLSGRMLSLSVDFGGARYNGEVVFKDARVREFIECALSSDFHRCDSLLGSGVDINYSGERGITPLWWIGCSGRKAAFKYVLRKGGKLEMRPERLPTILAMLARKGFDDLISIALESGISVDFPDESKEMTPLFAAIRGDNISTVKLLLERGADINYCYGNGDTPLMYSLGEHSGYKYTWLLLERGADFRKRNAMGRKLADVLMYGERVASEERIRARIRKFLEDRGEVVPEHPRRG